MTFSKEKIRKIYKEIQDLAEKRGLEENRIKGKLLTGLSEFERLVINNYPSRVKLKWSCEKANHNSWKTNTSEIKRGTWCPECSKEKLSFSFEYLQELVINRGLEETGLPGELVSTKKEYTEMIENKSPSKVKLKWWCGKDFHDPWEAEAKNIKGNRLRKGTWCPKCYRDKRILSFEYLLELAKRRGLEETGIPGILLSTQNEYRKLIKNDTPSKIKLKWWCGNNKHQLWEASTNSVSTGTWCPYCSEGKYEKICRWYFEQIFNKKFEKIALNSLIEDSIRNMHLDGYAEIYINGKIIKLAFEYDGYQHYEWPNTFHKNKTEFIRQQELDKLKKELCKTNNIFLINFPFKKCPRMNKPKIIQSYIIDTFQNLTDITIKGLNQYDYFNRNDKV
ncbi:hypothetical protein ES705_06724 [subsurface metagenome]